MMNQIYHPFQNPLMYVAPSHVLPRSGMSGGFFSNVLSGIGNLISGLANEIASVISNIVQTIANVVTKIMMTLATALNHLIFSVIAPGVVYLAKLYGKAIVAINPFRLTYNLFTRWSLTAHMFHELDKFTGGLITDAVNISDLPGRVMRGDNITKQELLRDALFAFKVVAVVYGGWAVVGGLVGGMVGKEFCKDAGNAKAACEAAAVIVGVAAGSYYADTLAIAELESDPAFQEALNEEGLTEANGLVDAAPQPFSSYMTDSVSSFANTQVTQIATKEAIKLCQANNWVGDQECAVIARITSDYVNTPPGTEWTDFLATEAGRLGIAALMAQWFPKKSPERHALLRRTHAYQGYAPAEVATVPKLNKALTAALLAGAGLFFLKAQG